MNAVCSDLLSLAALLRSADELPAPEVLRQRLLVALSEMSQRGAKLNLPEADIEDAQYALVALIDDQLLHSTWPARGQWSNASLSLTLFRDPNSGEGFFERLDELLRSPRDRSHVVQVYFYSLALGFEGKYRGQDGATLRELLSATRRHLEAAVPAPDVDFLSPAALPEAPVRPAPARRWLAWRLALGGVAASGLLLFVLRTLMSSGVADAIHKLHSF